MRNLFIKSADLPSSCLCIISLNLARYIDHEKMTKCAGCRVRHLNCDTRSTCTECEKSGRECVRLNVRFRHLVCPSGNFTRADYSKYDFFFGGDQTWIDTNGKLEFVADTSPTDEEDGVVFDARSLDTEPRPPLVHHSPSRFQLESTSHTPTIQESTPDDEPLEYLAALEQVPHDPPGSALLDDTLDTPAHSIRERSNMSTSSSGLPALPAPEQVWPVKNLQEGKLFQHFATHCAPWVCTDVRSKP